MPLAKCIRRCWDSQLTRRYWPGDQDNIAEDHPLVIAGCFQFVEQPKVIYREVPVAPVKVQTVVIPEPAPVEQNAVVPEEVEEPIKKK